MSFNGYENQETAESVKEKIANLPERLRKEWKSSTEYYSSKTKEERFEEFKKRWDNFEGSSVEEFLGVCKGLYKEWDTWKMENNYKKNFKGKSLKKILKKFKTYWEAESADSKEMFKEMELLSEDLLREWRICYTNRYPNVYSWEESKIDLWDSFIDIWEIDVENYNEEKYKEMNNFVKEIMCDDSDYRGETFHEYRTNANYHSFDDYSLIEQYEICKDWEKYRGRETDSDNESDDESSQDPRQE